eukprot:214450-Pleurochrysis_carterae.AAC.1
MSRGERTKTRERAGMRAGACAPARACMREQTQTWAGGADRQMEVRGRTTGPEARFRKRSGSLRRFPRYIQRVRAYAYIHDHSRTQTQMRQRGSALPQSLKAGHARFSTRTRTRTRALARARAHSHAHARVRVGHARASEIASAADAPHTAITSGMCCAQSQSRTQQHNRHE